MGKTKTKSPLRYPGGKTRAVDRILPHIPESERTVMSPFIGGGSVELALCDRGQWVWGYDAFEPLVTFWHYAQHYAYYLAEEVERRYHPLTPQEFRRLQRELPRMSGVVQAAAFYAVNRSSFSGSTLSGGMSPGHPRFNAAAIERLRRFSAPNLSVHRDDFRESIPRHPEEWLFCDPPYMLGVGRNSLYGRQGDLHRGFVHRDLADLLLDRGRWTLTYNDTPEIREMYSDDCEIYPASWSYGMRSGGVRELIIMRR